jgi:hypothetical protein
MISILTLCCLLPVQDQAGTTNDSAALLPPTTAVALQMPAPVEFVNAILEHPIHDQIKKDKTLGAFYRGPGLASVKAGVAIGEATLKTKWPEALKALAGSGITLAFDPKTNSAVAMLKSGNPAELKPLVEKIIEFVNSQRRDNNQKEITSSDYAGIPVFQLDNVAMALLPDRIVAATDKKLGKWILDAHLKSPDDTLATNKSFIEAQSKFKRTDSVSAFLDLEVVRASGGIEKLLEGSRANVLAEFLLGGVLETLSDSPFVTAGLAVTDDGIQLAAKTLHDPSKVSEPREFYFGPNSTGRAPVAVSIESGIGNIATYRDISKMWLYAGDLFDQKVNDGFAEAETGLSTLFAGKDFAEEILAEIKPAWQLVIARQDFANVLPRPAVKFPSFALVGEFKDVEKMNGELRRIYQSVIGFFNVVGAMEGNPQLEQDMSTKDGVKYLTSSFVPTPEEKESTEASIHYNFAPTLALGEKRFALSSSFALAEKAMAAKPANADQTNDANMEISIEAASLKEILTDNREQLIANNMLEEGHSRREAENQINIILGTIGWFKDLTASLVPSADELELTLQLSVRK